MADLATAIRKVQSGQPLTDNEKKLLGIDTPETQQDVIDLTRGSGISSNTPAPASKTPAGPDYMRLGMFSDIGASAVGGVTGPTGTGPTGTGPTGTGPTGTGPVKPKRKYTYTDEETGDLIDVYEDDTEVIRKKGTKIKDAQTAALAAEEEKNRKGQSAFDFLKLQFTNLGIGDLVAPLEELIKEGMSSDEMTLRLMNDPKYNKAYKTRFSANDARIAAGLRALSPAEYVGLEDKYQEVMRQAGLPESYYAKDATGKQIGFEKLIANDISNLELQDRIGTAQKRVLNANPEVTQALKQFYPDITNADILAYTLDPKNAIENIKRKVTTAEIGGAALQAGLQTGVNRADVLRAAGVTKESAQQGFGTIAGGLQRGSQLASIYGEDPYTQEVAETEVFNIAGAKEARKQRQKITGLEKATFGGQTGITSGALARDRAGGY